MRYVVLLYTSDRQVTVIVNGRGGLFASEKAALGVGRRIEREHPLWRALVVQVEAYS